MKKLFAAALVLILVIVFFVYQKPEEAFTDEAKNAPNEPQKISFAVPSQPLPILSEPTQKFSPPTIAKLKILDEIFASRNDNDSRLDTEFEEISPEVRAALIVSYKSLPKERLNERGTIIFLLGKKIEEEKDVDFFQDIIAEAPCLSLNDCNKESIVESLGDEHLAESQATTLVYPQLVALRLVSSNYQTTKETSLKERMAEFFKLAEQSPSEYIAEEAARIQSEAGIKP